MSVQVGMTVFFLDGTSMSFSYPQQSGRDQAAIVGTVKKAIDSERLVIEVAGDLLVIPMRSVKYVQVSPAPPHLPSGVLRKAQLRS
jgi:hypothetical protein